MRLFGLIFFGLGSLFLAIGVGVFVGLTGPGEVAEEADGVIVPAVFGLVGLIFALIGGGVLISIRNQRIKREALMRTGRKIRCEVTDVQANLHVKVNGRHPVKVHCQGDLSGRMVSFVSHNIYGSVKLNAGDPIDVYVDFRNDGNYWVEIPPDAVRG